MVDRLHEALVGVGLFTVVLAVTFIGSWLMWNQPYNHISTGLQLAIALLIASLWRLLVEWCKAQG